MRSSSPARIEVGSSSDGADLFEFSERAAVTVLNYLCVLIVEADQATTSLGEERMKEIITDGIGAVRHALEEVSRNLPHDEHTQREYAQRFLEATREGGDTTMSASAADGGHMATSLIFDTGANAENVDGASIEWQVSPMEMRRVGGKFGALQLPYTEQDIVNALGWVRTMISDVQNVLLEFDDNDLEELAQMTLISLRILVGYAKSTHRNLAQLCRVPYAPRGPRNGIVSARSRPDGGSAAGGDATASEPSSPYQAASGEPSLFQIDDQGEEEDDSGGLPWEPLAPRLLREAHRLAREGKDRPLTAAVVLAAALPFSGAAVCIGAPVLAADAALQWGAGTPMGRAVGQGTKNAVELGKLGWVASKLTAKQTLRLATQELHRVGGVTGLACQAREGALWTVSHPIDAAVAATGMAADMGSAVYEHALWVGDLLAAIGEEIFAGPVESSESSSSSNKG